MNTLILSVLGSLFVVGITLTVTYIINSKNKTSAGDWDIGGRNIPIYVIIGTQFATAMGGGILVGHLGNAYTNGLVVLIYGFLVFLGFVILTVIAKWLRREQFTTVPEILARFSNDNKLVKLIAAIMSIVVPLGWLASQITAFGKLYAALTGLNYTLLVVIVAVVSLLFVMPSGLKTVAWTDFIFACFMLVLCSISLFYAVEMAGGTATALQNIPKNLITFPDTIENIGWYALFVWIFAILPGSLTNQMYYQRIYAIDTEKKVNTSLIISAIVTFIAFVWATVMGITIRSIEPGLESANVTGWFLSKLNPIMIAAFAGLIMATIMSTISSAVQSVVVNITRDIYPLIKGKKLEGNHSLKISRMLSPIVLAVTVILALYFPDVIGLLVYSYALSAASLLCPIFVGYALKDKNIITPTGLIASMVIGIVSSIVFIFIKTPIPYVGWGIMFSLISLLAVSYITKNTKK